MLRAARLLAAENETGEDEASIRSPVRADMEDALVLALWDTLREDRLLPFREFLARYGRDLELDEELYLALRHNDYLAWLWVYHTTCSLRRLNFCYQAAWNRCWTRLGVWIEHPGGEMMDW